MPFPASTHCYASRPLPWPHPIIKKSSSLDASKVALPYLKMHLKHPCCPLESQWCFRSWLMFWCWPGPSLSLCSLSFILWWHNAEPSWVAVVASRQPSGTDSSATANLLVNEAWQGTQLSDKLQRGSGNCTMLYKYSSPRVIYVLPSKNCREANIRAVFYCFQRSINQ